MGWTPKVLILFETESLVAPIDICFDHFFT